MPPCRRTAPLQTTASQQSQPLQSAFPSDIHTGWRIGPQDSAGATVRRQLFAAAPYIPVYTYLFTRAPHATTMCMQATSAMCLSFLSCAPASIGRLGKWLWGRQTMLYMLWTCKAARSCARCTPRLLAIQNGSQHVSTYQMVASFLAAWTARCACGRPVVTGVSS